MIGSMSITLYDLAGAEPDRRFSPYCWRTKMALKHKGLEFNTVPWRFTEKEKIAFAGSSTVPVIVDGGTAVADSWKIALYLEEAYPSRPALFEGAQSLALSEFFANWAFRTVHPAMLKVIVMDVYSRLHEGDRRYFRETREKRFGTTLEDFAGDPNQSLAALRGTLDPVRPLLVQRPFIGGHGPGYCDYVLFGVFQWARAVSPRRLLEPDDPMYAWRERMLDLFGGFARSAKGYEVWV
jgi:glutathione S-transferase